MMNRSGQWENAEPGSNVHGRGHLGALAELGSLKRCGYAKKSKKKKKKSVHHLCT
jgi:hypothetical protein